MQIDPSTLFGTGGILVAIITGVFLLLSKRTEKKPDLMAAEDNRIKEAALLFKDAANDQRLEADRLRKETAKLREQNRETRNDLDAAHKIIRDVVPWADKSQVLLEPYEVPKPVHNEDRAQDVRRHREIYRSLRLKGLN